MSKSGKNTHMTHIAESIITDGSKGGEHALEVLKLMSQFLSGKGGSSVAVTTKYDGAPAVICGTDPADGRFFVGTKSVFSQTPKLGKSITDIQNLYSGGVVQKLVDAYTYLKDCKIKGVLQGDLMFTNDKKSERIDGKNYITFRPNTITYAADPNSPLGKDVSKAKLGIVFHTKYTGDTLATMKASFDVKETDFTPTDQVWAKLAEFKDIGNVAALSGSERSKYEASIRRAEGSFKQSKRLMDKIQTGKKPLTIDAEFLKFFNAYVREGKEIPSVDRAYVDFYHHLGKEYDKVIKKYKTLKSQEKKVGQFLENVEFISKHEREFKMLIATYMNLEYCKNLLLSKMKKVKKLNLFVDMGGGNYKVTDDEGYVAITSKGAVKLVDRLEFSKLNFTVEKIWG